MSAAAFRNGQFGGIGRVSSEQMRSAGLVRGALPMAPSRANLSFSGRAAAFTPRTAAATHFFTHQQPAAVQHMSFAQQRSAMEGNTRPAGNAAGAGGRQFGTAAGGARAADPAGMARGGQSAAPAGGGWRRFGEPGGQSPSPAGRGESNESRGQNPVLQNTRPSQAGGSGWDRFGEPGSRQSSPGYSAPRYSAPNYSAPRYSAPSYSAPRYSAPAGRSSSPSYSAPRSGGGGGSRSSGGGHSSGGHGHR